jgi:hypothetical protein
MPIEKMVAAPLLAAIHAQGQMSLAMAEFINNVGIDKNGNIRMVTFKYEERTENPDGTTGTDIKYIEAPFLALTGIPNLAVEQVNVSFELEVNTAEDSKSSTSSDVKSETDASFKSWWSPASVSTKFTASVSHASEQTRHTDTRAKYSFNVSARRQPAPEAFSRIVDAIINSTTKPTNQKLESNLIGDKPKTSDVNKPVKPTNKEKTSE